MSHLFGNPEINERQQTIADLARSESYQTAAERFQITFGRVNEIVRLVKKMEARKRSIDKAALLPIERRPIILTPLPARVRSALTEAGYIACGELLTVSVDTLLALPKFGKAGLRDLELYLGFQIARF